MQPLWQLILSKQLWTEDTLGPLFALFWGRVKMHANQKRTNKFDCMHMLIRSLIALRTNKGNSSAKGEKLQMNIKLMEMLTNEKCTHEIQTNRGPVAM